MSGAFVSWGTVTLVGALRAWEVGSDLAGALLFCGATMIIAGLVDWRRD